MKTSKAVSKGSKEFAFHFGAFSVSLGYDLTRLGLAGASGYDRTEKVLDVGGYFLVLHLILSYDFSFVEPV